MDSLHTLYAELNRDFFDGILPRCRLEWSRRLTRAAGTIDVKKRLIRLSEPLLIEAFRSDTLFPPTFEVCGVACEDADEALAEIMKHEMIHLWLHVRGRPCGHTSEFRAKAKEVGQPKTRHGIALPEPKSGWVYTCPVCGTTISRRRRFGVSRACGPCCRRFNKGKFDERFKLRGRRVDIDG